MEKGPAGTREQGDRREMNSAGNWALASISHSSSGHRRGNVHVIFQSTHDAFSILITLTQTPPWMGASRAL